MYMPLLPRVTPNPNNGYTWLIQGGFTQKCDQGIRVENKQDNII